MTVEEIKKAVRVSLGKLNGTVEKTILRELKSDIQMSEEEVLQFEICPTYYRIHLTQTENDILEEFFLESDFEEEAEEKGIDIFDIQNDEIVVWFSERWKAVEGPSFFKPAYIYFHGGFYQDRFDLENQTWIKAEKYNQKTD